MAVTVSVPPQKRDATLKSASITAVLLQTPAAKHLQTGADTLQLAGKSAVWGTLWAASLQEACCSVEDAEV